MILSKFFMNQIIGGLNKHFRLDKMMNYVFKDNELDDKVKNMEDRLKILESLAHPSKDLKCKYKNEKEIKYG